MPNVQSVSRLALVAATLAGAATAGAQLPSASPAALGMADNYTAMARGFGAVAWNPANLGLPHNPRFSLTLLGVRGSGDLGPISTDDLARYQGVRLPNEVRDEWMQRIEYNGGEQGQLGGGVTLFGMSTGRFAVQVATTASMDANLAPGAMELALYGNAGRTGSAQDITLDGAHLTGAVTTTTALSWAHPIDLGLARLSFGATAKYIMGNMLVHGEDRGSQLSASSSQIDLRFPIILSDTGNSSRLGNHGSGVGIDVGGAWASGPITASLAIQNVVNTFQWDASSFFYKPIQAYYGRDTSYSNSNTTLPLDSAPADVREWLNDQRFKPILSAGVAMQVSPRLTLAADVRREMGEGLRVGDRTHVGLGAELRLLPFVPLRTGFAVNPQGIVLAAGTGLELGRVNLTVSAEDRRSANGHAPGAAVGLSFGGR
ncbi:MAG TPA: DUF5723 family protein [Gemmatimonadaceae bacterium]|nr:DUF5723 family protein [Gemmatimonadaceae bacterium]